MEGTSFEQGAGGPRDGEPSAPGDQTRRALREALHLPTGLSSAGYPYLSKEAWDKVRDHVPHLFAHGGRVLDWVEEEVAVVTGDDGESAESVRRAARAMRQVVMTAAVTAPPDLWLLRHVLGAFGRLGLLGRLLEGDAIYPASCEVTVGGSLRRLVPAELEKDLHFLLARGLVEQYEDSFRLAGHPRVAELLRAVSTLPPTASRSRYRLWARALAGETIDPRDAEALAAVPRPPSRPAGAPSNHWIPSVREVEVGYLLVPLVLGLRAVDRTSTLTRGEPIDRALESAGAALARAASEILGAAGWLEVSARRRVVSALGERGFARGPGPFGIVEAYHAYMVHAVDILLGADPFAWVRRSDNVAASQDANQSAFRRANDALDRFCADTGFTLPRVHRARPRPRRSESRQRWERSGRRRAGPATSAPTSRMPAIEGGPGRATRAAAYRPATWSSCSQRRHRPAGGARCVDAARSPGRRQTEGAVMVVGNGFHEVRGQTRRDA